MGLRVLSDTASTHLASDALFLLLFNLATQTSLQFYSLALHPLATYTLVSPSDLSSGEPITEVDNHHYNHRYNHYYNHHYSHHYNHQYNHHYNHHYASIRIKKASPFIKD